MSFRMTLSDLEWVNKIFNDTKHPAVSLRQLSFLYLGMYFMFYGNAIKHKFLRLDSAVPPTVVTECIVRFFLILVLSGSYSSRTTAFKCFYSNTTEHLCSLLTVHSSHRFGWAIGQSCRWNGCLPRRTSWCRRRLGGSAGAIYRSRRVTSPSLYPPINRQ